MSTEPPEYPDYLAVGKAPAAAADLPSAADSWVEGRRSRPIEQPWSIQVAVRMMKTGAGIGFGWVLITLMALDTLKFDVKLWLLDRYPDVDRFSIEVVYLLAYTAGIAVPVIGILGWLWMAWKNGQGRAWARIVASALAGLDSAHTVFTLRSEEVDSIEKIMTAGTLMLALVVVVLLWLKPSSAFYEAGDGYYYA